MTAAKAPKAQKLQPQKKIGKVTKQAAETTKPAEELAPKGVRRVQVGAYGPVEMEM